MVALPSLSALNNRISTHSIHQGTSHLQRYRTSVPYLSSIFEVYRTITKKAYRTSVQYFFAKNEAYRTAGPPRGGGAGGDNDTGAHELERGLIQIALSNKRAIEINFSFFGEKQSKFW